MFDIWLKLTNKIPDKITPQRIEGLETDVSELTPLTPRSDWKLTSPYNNLNLSSKQVMGIFKLIRSKLLPWSDTKFS